MAITYVNGTTATQATAATESLTLNVPTGVANTNLMAVVGVVNSSTATLATPSGWSQLWSKTQSTCTTALWVRAASSEPASYTWTWNATGIGAYACAAWAGVSTTSVVEGAANSGIAYLSGTAATPSITPSQPDLVLAIYTDQRGSSTGTTWTTPSGLTARVSTSVTGVATECSVALFDTGGQISAGAAVSYASTPTSGTASVVTGILGVMPPRVMPGPLIIRQAVQRAAYY